ncbi:MAG: hypothetical protein ACJAUP_000495 [Cellvibrionaceae bacterium]|jgi:hypothetical protein
MADLQAQNLDCILDLAFFQEDNSNAHYQFLGTNLGKLLGRRLIAMDVDNPKREFMCHIVKRHRGK